MFTALLAFLLSTPAPAVQQQATPAKPATTTQDPKTTPQTTPDPTTLPGGKVFDMGKIEVVGNPNPEGLVGVGGVSLGQNQMWTFDRTSLDQAVNVLPGVNSQFDSGGRRNESDIFVRGFGRWQVPLMIDGVRVYLPADNRLDFQRFLTADIAAVQIQKGYASVLDGPGEMGGAINLVTRKPAKALEAEASASISGRDSNEGWTGYAMAGTLQKLFYVHGSVNFSNRDYTTLSSNYTPTPTSLQQSHQRLNSDTSDSRINFKAGFTPTATDEYTINFIKQDGDKGGQLNVYNTPPVPANGFWRWPYWDIQNTALLTKTHIGGASFVRGKLYYTTFKNGLNAYDDITFTTQSNNGRFSSPYDDHATGGDVEVDVMQRASNTLKASGHYRTDVHKEQQTNRPTNPNPALATTEPVQTQALNTSSFALEDTVHVTPRIDIVGGMSYEKYDITQAQEFNTTKGLFDLPKGGSDSLNWQSAIVWRQTDAVEIHASVSDRSRFPTIFELYSTRFGTATPNPDLGPERAMNVEFGWKSTAMAHTRFEGAFFYSQISDLITTVQLADLTTQPQNVGDGHFYGAEFALDVQLPKRLAIGGNYTYLRRTVNDPLQPTLQATGVPTNKAFLYATWRPIPQLSITPSLDIAGDRWSDYTTSPVQAIPYIRTGAYTVVNIAAEYAVTHRFAVVFGFKNATDDNYELSWGYPQPGRTMYFKTRFGL